MICNCKHEEENENKSIACMCVVMHVHVHVNVYRNIFQSKAKPVPTYHSTVKESPLLCEEEKRHAANNASLAV